MRPIWDSKEDSALEPVQKTLRSKRQTERSAKEWAQRWKDGKIGQQNASERTKPTKTKNRTHTWPRMGERRDARQGRSTNHPAAINTHKDHAIRTRSGDMEQPRIYRTGHWPSAKEPCEPKCTRKWWNTRRSIQSNKKMGNRNNNTDNERSKNRTYNNRKLDQWGNCIHILEQRRPRRMRKL